MKSLETLALRKMKRMNNRGQAIDVTSNTMLGLFGLILIVFAILLAISTLNPGSFFTAGSASRNATVALQDNTTQVASNFSQQLPTVGTILGVVLIIGFVGLLIFIVRRFAGGSGSGGGL